ncbi:MAG: hypothetical protein A2X82_20115 [Geobacteraceae bacterium GWC2_55_20]|nr:MAG: hypothetical protein A2X82_20115 [Geobacteraceae bacterium GWC2_55_20]OGU24439.1 MAG: hypothetical protein A2X85_09355 [Geobacteraceae bacterium GWF2_54_21]HCE68400.1 hypothetical protein [Geobacter sp.]
MLAASCKEKARRGDSVKALNPTRYPLLTAKVLERAELSEKPALVTQNNTSRMITNVSKDAVSSSFILFSKMAGVFILDYSHGSDRTSQKRRDS